MTRRPLSCPSTPEDQPDAVVFGVVGGTVERPMVAYLTSSLPASDGTSHANCTGHTSGSVPIRGDMRQTACQNFQDGRCSVTTRLVAVAKPVVDQLPRCAIRSTCRWWAENGRASCVRCPSVVTVDYAPTPEAVAIAGPSGVNPGQ